MSASPSTLIDSTLAVWQTTKGIEEGDLVVNNQDPKNRPAAGQFAIVLGIESQGRIGKKFLLSDGTSFSIGNASKLWVIKDALDVEENRISSDTAGDLAPAPIEVGNHEEAEKIAAKADAKATKQAKAMVKCGCGCGKLCARSFLPGHDAKLKGQLIRTVIDGGKGADKARAALEERGWTHFLVKSQEKAARVKAQREEQNRRYAERVAAQKAKREEAKKAKAAAKKTAKAS